MKKSLIPAVLILVSITALALFTSQPRSSTASVAQASPSDAPGLAALFPDGLTDAEGNPIPLDTLQNKVIGVYFSAHWCGPCRRFTPELVKYREANRDHFEVVFVSSDRTEDAWRNYMTQAGMPWPAVHWNSDAANALKSRYEIRGIPSVIMLRDDGSTITREGRRMVMQGTAAEQLLSARVEMEEYMCDSCDKVHTRAKLVYDR